MALKYLEDFQQVLKNYQPSQSIIKTLSKIPLAFLVAPTASGRNTIINHLIKTDRYHFIVSDTTRSPRVNNGVLERNGHEYWFRSESEMLDDLRAGKFLEAAIIHEQQVSGTSVREIENSARSGKIAINEIEVVGADNIHNFKPDTAFIFVVAPDFDTWMERLTARNKMPIDELRRRLESAKNELEVALNRGFYDFVVNQDIDDASALVDDIVTTRKTNQAQQIHARKVAKELLGSVSDYLGQ